MPPPGPRVCLPAEACTAVWPPALMGVHVWGAPCLSEALGWEPAPCRGAPPPYHLQALSRVAFYEVQLWMGPQLKLGPG